MAVRPEPLDVFQEDVFGPLGFADSDDVVEKGTSSVVFTFPKANLREWLAREATRKDVEVRQFLGVNRCDVTEEGDFFVVFLVKLYRELIDFGKPNRLMRHLGLFECKRCATIARESLKKSEFCLFHVFGWAGPRRLSTF